MLYIRCTKNRKLDQERSRGILSLGLRADMSFAGAGDGQTRHALARLEPASTQPGCPALGETRRKRLRGATSPANLSRGLPHRNVETSYLIAE